MPEFDAVTPDHVLSALREHDECGAEQFLSRYGFGKAREYVLWHDGRSYDSKAVLGVAHKYAAGTAATSAEFSGGKDGAARILRELGFDVTAVNGSDDPAAPESGEWRDVADVGSEVARNAWAEAAREVLLDAAARYRTVVTHKELASEVQERT